MIHLSEKEIKRASSDGYVIVIRPSAKGGFNVFAVNIKNCEMVGSYNENIEPHLVPITTTEVARDLDIYFGDVTMNKARHRPGKKHLQGNGLPANKSIKP